MYRVRQRERGGPDYRGIVCSPQAASKDDIRQLDKTKAVEMFVSKCNSQLTYEGIFFSVKVCKKIATVREYGQVCI